ncbi:MAG: hypothetical protein GQ477_04410 [Nanohaloarchaea archaeon]|nr:hypothetical protein [Candidatus Nanohaloarchaea archaeon]
MDLYDLIGNLQDVGFYDILLPWALFFAMVYGLLTKFGPFNGQDQKSIVSIISMVVAFFVVGFTPFGMSFGTYLAEMFGKSGTVLAGLLVASLFLGMAGMRLPDGFGKEEDKKKINFAIIVLLIVGVIYFTTGFDNIIDFSSPNIAEETIVTLLVILALAGGIVMMMKGDGKTIEEHNCHIDGCTETFDTAEKLKKHQKDKHGVE